MTTRTWFITGASRGIGLETARAALAAGHQVVATGRRRGDVIAALGESEALLALELDVTVPAQIAAAVDAARERFGRIDVLVNNAGYGHLGLFEQTTDADVRAQFETNVFGLFNVTRAVLPLMRAQRGGHVINLSSVAGIAGFAMAGIYCASKFAVEGFSLSLAEEVRQFGICVTIVGPGFIRTDFLDPSSFRLPDIAVPDYADMDAQLRNTYLPYNHLQPGDPVRLAQALLQLADRADPPLRFSAGSDALEMVGARLAQLGAELDAERALSASVDGQWA
ncbi:oxidoreductase [Pseudoxanthomonas suwonensis]|uniref:Short-chain dehydrogenase n=1 Tax=Pseudoxanthomonas suwonensis TaxID=314722 RepID=A0A0E3UNE2_9GAMM|nr:oxidoreductase [Pseudoxanthomonas suwonensis]AKC87091.1 short-chain dehydrogenase [Pseudoxanthomonas suwonensis]